MKTYIDSRVLNEEQTMELRKLGFYLWADKWVTDNLIEYKVYVSDMEDSNESIS